MSKVLFFDVDGTLTNFEKGINTLNDDLLSKLKEIKAQGNHLFIATGRPYAFVNEYLKSLDFDGFVMANGGHVIVDEKTVYENILEENRIVEVVEFLDRHEIQYMIQDNKYGYIKSEFVQLIEFYKTAAIREDHLVYEYDESVYSRVIKMEIQLPVEHKDEFTAILGDDFNYDYNYSLNYLELYAKGVTKAEGIKKTLDYYDLDIANSFAFGDGYNDIEMISTVGTGVVMGNGVPPLKEVADFVTDDFMDNGLLKALNKFF